MFLRLTSIYFLFLMTACTFSNSEIGRSQDSFTNFFLCFPEIDQGFSKLPIEQQLEIRKQIGQEKKNRKFSCSEFSNFMAVKENVDKLNEEIFEEKSAPCKRVNIEECEAR